MSTFASLEEQLDLITKGAAEILPLEALKERIAKLIEFGCADAMRIKAGFDCTAPDLHLGHTVLIRKLRHFQKLWGDGDLFDWGFDSADWRSDGAEMMNALAAYA